MRSVDVSCETIPLTQRILLIYLLCFMWNMGNACEGNLLRLRLCFEACFMGWVWRIRINECWIGRVLSFSFVFSWFYCGGAWLCFLVFEGFSMFHVKHDVFTTTHLFHVKHCFCFTTSQGCQCVSRETQGGVVKLLVMVFENSFSCRC